MVVEHNLVAHGEGPVGQVVHLEGCHGTFGDEVACVASGLNGGPQVEQGGHVLLRLAVDDARGVGDGHGNLHAEGIELVILPLDEAAVFSDGIKWVRGSLEDKLEVARRVADDEVAQQSQHAVLGEESVGRDAQAWRAEDEHILVFKDVAVGQRDGTDEVHHGIRRRECHVANLQAEVLGQVLLDLIGGLKGEVEVAQVALLPVFPSGLGLLVLGVVFA